jgi:hypothetical protein
MSNIKKESRGAGRDCQGNNAENGAFSDFFRKIGVRSTGKAIRSKYNPLLSVEKVNFPDPWQLVNDYESRRL